MASIILPEHVKIGLDFDQHMERLRDRHGFLRWFERELQNIDPLLSLVKAQGNAQQYGVIPGAWHIKRDNPETLPTFIPLVNPDGTLSEPHTGWLEALKRRDMQRSGAFEEFKREQERMIKAQLDDPLVDQRREEIKDRIKFHENPSVSMVGGWTNSVRQRKARKDR